MKYAILAATMTMVSSCALAQTYSAKSLFFGEDNSIVAVKTTRNPTAATVQSPNVASKLPETATSENATKTANLNSVASRVPVAQVASKNTSKPKNVGVSYFIRLKNPDGTTSDVLASRKFKTGERFQLGVKVNLPSYLYILNEGSDGKMVQIYPQPGHDNFIDAMGTVFLPSKGAFEFDAVPGIEKLSVYLSPKPIDSQIASLLQSAQPDVIFAGSQELASNSQPACIGGEVNGPQLIAKAGDGSDYGAKGIIYSNSSSSSCSGPTQNAPAYASKGIVFSDDNAPSAGNQVATYVVKTVGKADKSLYLKLALKHE